MVYLNDYNFSEIDFTYENEALILCTDSVSTTILKFSFIQKVHLTHVGSKNASPCIIIYINSGEKYKINGFNRYLSHKADRKAYREFIIELHNKLIPFQRTIIFTCGINIPKPFSIILAVAGSGLLVNNINNQNFTSEGLGYPFTMLVVGLMLFFRSGGKQYNPNEIPTRFLK